MFNHVYSLRAFPPEKHVFSLSAQKLPSYFPSFQELLKKFFAKLLTDGLLKDTETTIILP